MDVMARPRKEQTEDLIRLIKQELRKKVHGTSGRYTKAELLARTLVRSALAKNEDGSFNTDGVGEFNMKSLQFCVEAVHGKPTERRETTINVFAHYPEAERAIDVNNYKVIPVQPVEVQ
jgi:hypothetical protein